MRTHRLPEMCVLVVTTFHSSHPLSLEGALSCSGERVSVRGNGDSTRRVRVFINSAPVSCCPMMDGEMPPDYRPRNFLARPISDQW